MKLWKRIVAGLSAAAIVLGSAGVLPEGGFGALCMVARAEGEVAIDATNFPDEVFRTYVSESFDNDPKDGMLSEEEIAGVTSIDVSHDDDYNGVKISSLKGIEHFPNLSFLWCDNNSLTDIDVSNNPNLYQFDCSGNQITEIDISNCKNISTFGCSDNKIKTIKLGGNTNLSGFDCSNNQIEKLDLTDCTNLYNFKCYDNYINSIDVSNCTRLNYLLCYGNRLKSLDISNNVELETLGVGNNELTTLNVSKNENLKSLSFGDNYISEINLDNNKILEDLSCGNNRLTELDLSNNTQLSGLFCDENRLTSRDLSKNTKLSYLSCSENMLTCLDLSKNTELSSINCEKNIHKISTSNNIFSLSDLPGFDADKASNWKGAEYDKSNNSIHIIDNRSVTFDYDCGGGHSANFKLVKTWDANLKYDEKTGLLSWDNAPNEYIFDEYVLGYIAGCYNIGTTYNRNYGFYFSGFSNIYYKYDEFGNKLDTIDTPVYNLPVNITTSALEGERNYGYKESSRVYDLDISYTIYDEDENEISIFSDETFTYNYNGGIINSKLALPTITELVCDNSGERSNCPIVSFLVTGDSSTVGFIVDDGKRFYALNSYDLLNPYGNGKYEIYLDYEYFPETIKICSVDKNGDIGNWKSIELDWTQNKSVKSLTVTPPSPVPNFYTGDDFDPTGYKLTVKYDDNSTEIIDLTDEMVSGNKTDMQTGRQTLTATYGGKTATFSVTVTELKIDSIAIKAEPTKAFELGDEFTTGEGSIEATYNNGYTETLLMTAEDVTVDNSKFRNDKAGTYTITVKYGGKTVTYDVDVSVSEASAVAVLTDGTDTYYYTTVAEAIAKITSLKNSGADYTITVKKDANEKALTFPKEAKSITLTTTDGAVLKTTATTITANSSLTLNANIVHVDTKGAPDGKKIAVKAAANSTLTIDKAFDDIGAISGANTSALEINADAVYPGITTFAAVTVGNGVTATVDGGKFTVPNLSGDGTLEVKNAATVTVTTAESANITLHQYEKVSGKTTTVLLPKLTVTTADDLTITVKDPAGEDAEISGQTILQLAKTNAVENLEQKIKFTNKDADENTLSAVQYGKDVRAEWLGALTLNDGTNNTHFSSLEKAFEQINADAKAADSAKPKQAYKSYTITLNTDMAPEKFALPAKAAGLKIVGDGEAKVLMLQKLSSLAPAYDFTLENVALMSVGTKAFAISAKKDLTVKNCVIEPVPNLSVPAGCTLTLDGENVVFGKISGNKTATLEVRSNNFAAEIATFGNVNVADEKMLTVTGKMTGIETLNGDVELADATSSAVVTNVGDASFILRQGVDAKTNAFVISKLTVTAVTTGLSIEVVDSGDEDAALASGTTVMTAGKDTLELTKITLENKTTGNEDLTLKLYKKDVRAEVANTVTLGDGENEKSFNTIEEAFEQINTDAKAKNAEPKNYTITLNTSISPEKFTLPSKAGSITIKSEGAAKTLILPKTASLAPAYDFTLENVNIISSGVKAFAITAKKNLTIEDCEISPAANLSAAAGFTLTLDGENSAFGKVSGTKTSVLSVNTNNTVSELATFGNVNVAANKTLTVNGKVSGIEQLDGMMKITSNTATVAITKIGTAKLILTKDNNATAKATINEIGGSLTLEIVDAEGNDVDIASGTPIFTLGGKNDFTEKVIISNKDAADNDLDAVLYKKEICAEYDGTITVGGGITGNYSSLENAITAINANEATLKKAKSDPGNYTLTLNTDTFINKLALPASAASLTIKSASGVKTITMTGTTSLTAKYDLTLKDVKLVNLNAKNAESALTINQSSGNLTIDNVVCDTLSAVKGGAKFTLDLGACSKIETVSGFGVINLNEDFTAGKTLTTTTLNIENSVTLTVPSGCAVTTKDLNGPTEEGESGTIKLEPGFKPIKISGSANGNIDLVSDGPIADNVQILDSAKCDLTVFDVTGIAPDNGREYILARTGSKVYCKAAVLTMNDVKYASWNDAIAAMTDKNTDYEVTLIEDVDAGKDLKLPAAAKCKSLTIDGDGKTLTFVGTSVTLNTPTTMKNITVTALKQNSKTKAYEPTNWTLKNSSKLTADETVKLTNCEKK